MSMRTPHFLRMRSTAEKLFNCSNNVQLFIKYVFNAEVMLAPSQHEELH